MPLAPCRRINLLAVVIQINRDRAPVEREWRCPLAANQAIPRVLHISAIDVSTEDVKVTDLLKRPGIFHQGLLHGIGRQTHLTEVVFQRPEQSGFLQAQSRDNVILGPVFQNDVRRPRAVMAENLVPVLQIVIFEVAVFVSHFHTAVNGLDVLLQTPHIGGNPGGFQMRAVLGIEHQKVIQLVSVSKVDVVWPK